MDPNPLTHILQASVTAKPDGILDIELASSVALPAGWTDEFHVCLTRENRIGAITCPVRFVREVGLRCHIEAIPPARGMNLASYFGARPDSGFLDISTVILIGPAGEVLEIENQTSRAALNTAKDGFSDPPRGLHPLIPDA